MLQRNDFSPVIIIFLKTSVDIDSLGERRQTGLAAAVDVRAGAVSVTGVAIDTGCGIATGIGNGMCNGGG